MRLDNLTSESECRTVFLIKRPRAGYVSARDLMESVVGRLKAQFEWYREHVYYARLKENPLGRALFFIYFKYITDI